MLAQWTHDFITMLPYLHLLGQRRTILHLFGEPILYCLPDVKYVSFSCCWPYVGMLSGLSEELSKGPSRKDSLYWVWLKWIWWILRSQKWQKDVWKRVIRKTNVKILCLEQIQTEFNFVGDFCMMKCVNALNFAMVFCILYFIYATVRITVLLFKQRI